MSDHAHLRGVPIRAVSSTDKSPQALKDPVCGMVVTAQSPHTLQYEGKSFYFCCAGCKAKFAANPLKYLGGSVPPETMPPPPSAASTVAAIVYTCPMHPEVRRDRPGACPICGMALEPETPSLDEGENPELVDFRHRFSGPCR